MRLPASLGTFALLGITMTTVAHTQALSAMTIVSTPGISWTDSFGVKGRAVLTYGHAGCKFVDARGFCVGGIWPSIAGAHWIWKSQLLTPVEATDGDPPVAFAQTFFLPSHAHDMTGRIRIAADDVYALFVNGNFIGGDSTSVEQTPFSVKSYNVTPRPGLNRIQVVVVGLSGGAAATPAESAAGLLYRMDVTYRP